MRARARIWVLRVRARAAVCAWVCTRARVYLVDDNTVPRPLFFFGRFLFFLFFPVVGASNGSGLRRTASLRNEDTNRNVKVVVVAVVWLSPGEPSAGTGSVWCVRGVRRVWGVLF